MQNTSREYPPRHCVGRLGSIYYPDLRRGVLLLCWLFDLWLRMRDERFMVVQTRDAEAENGLSESADGLAAWRKRTIRDAGYRIVFYQLHSLRRVSFNPSSGYITGGQYVLHLNWLPFFWSNSKIISRKNPVGPKQTVGKGGSLRHFPRRSFGL